MVTYWVFFYWTTPSHIIESHFHELHYPINPTGLTVFSEVPICHALAPLFAWCAHYRALFFSIVTLSTSLYIELAAKRRTTRWKINTQSTRTLLAPQTPPPNKTLPTVRNMNKYLLCPAVPCCATRAKNGRGQPTGRNNQDELLRMMSMQTWIPPTNKRISTN